MAKPKTDFSLNQKVVYPSQGVGQITNIYKGEFNGESVYFYEIYIEVSDMYAKVPVANASKLGIRAIVSADEALKALNSITDEFEAPTSDWKLRYQMNMDLLKKGTIQDIAVIVRSLYKRSKVKELPILERKLYDSAKKMLEDEIAYALGKSAKEVEDMLHAKLEPIGAKSEKKNTFDDDEDEDEFDDETTSSKDSDDDEDEDEDDEDIDEDEDDDDDPSDDDLD
ncbi:MAG: CarD family transcriptional regulator [Treponema sp.]|nr:CarD family transcriptional regulator [Treponema sp.]